VCTRAHNSKFLMNPCCFVELLNLQGLMGNLLRGIISVKKHVERCAFDGVLALDVTADQFRSVADFVHTAPYEMLDSTSIAYTRVDGQIRRREIHNEMMLPVTATPEGLPASHIHKRQWLDWKNNAPWVRVRLYLYSSFTLHNYMFLTGGTILCEQRMERPPNTNNGTSKEGGYRTGNILLGNGLGIVEGLLWRKRGSGGFTHR
jgi:hypothetical protein